MASPTETTPETEEPKEEVSPALDDEACSLTVSKVTIDATTFSIDPATKKPTWIVRASDGSTFFTIVLRGAEGGDKPDQMKGEFGAEQRSPAAASVSVMLQTECEAHGDHYHCGPTYLADKGSFEFTKADARVGGRIAGKFSTNAIAVTLKKGVGTPVANGKTVCARAVSIDAELSAPN